MRARPELTRRGILRGVAGAAVGAAGLAAAGRSRAQPSFDGWLDDVSNYDGIVDERGSETATVEVGVEANDGAFGYGPAAIQVDPGTTVQFEWTGEGGQHNVVVESGADFESDLTADPGVHFEHTFEEAGVVKYFCTPHRSLGMKGVVVVGSVPGGQLGEPDYGGWFDDVSNYDGTVDERGTDQVGIDVGLEANDGAFGFGPPAVRVSPGTTVVWEWTGDGGQHNVVAEDGAFESELTAEAGFTFEHTFEDRGVYRYACTPHRGLGMKGAVVVGDVSGGSGGDGSGGDGGSGDGGSGDGGSGADGGPAVEPPGGPFGSAFLAVVGGLFGLAAVALAAAEAGNSYRQWKRERAETVPDGPPTEAAPTVVERLLGHDEFDPKGTAALIVAYFLIITAMWVVMYFVKFLGNGPTVVG